jgi:hypothetical protein
MFFMPSEEKIILMNFQTIYFFILFFQDSPNITDIMLVMLLWVYIHTGQAWKICLATVGIEPTTFGILAQSGVDIHSE